MKSPDIKYPEIEVQLTGQDGNAFNVLGLVRKAMLKGGVPREEIKKFLKEATAGGYDDLLATCQQWVNCY